MGASETDFDTSFEVKSLISVGFSITIENFNLRLLPDMSSIFKMVFATGFLVTWRIFSYKNFQIQTTFPTMKIFG